MVKLGKPNKKLCVVFICVVLIVALSITVKANPTYNVKTGQINTGTTATTVTFSGAMPSTNYAVLLSGPTDTDTMYSMAYLNKQTTSFQIMAAYRRLQTDNKRQSEELYAIPINRIS